MERESAFVIGDVHGCLGVLERLLDRIPWRPGRDSLVFIGDAIDRGKDSKGVVDSIIRLMRAYPKVSALLGNHEAMLLNYLAGRERDLYLANRGMTTLRSYGVKWPGREDSFFPSDHISFFRSLGPFMELDGYYLVHAGFRPGVEVGRQTVEDMTWIREPFISSGYDFGKKVVFGHTPFSRPLVMDNKIGVDTGAVYGNRLTCVELPEERFYSVDSR